MALKCKYLKGDGRTWYDCTFRNKRCAYQRFCSRTRRYLIDKCSNCPAFKKSED